MRRLAIVLTVIAGITAFPATGSAGTTLSYECTEHVQVYLSGQVIFNPEPEKWDAGTCVRDVVVVRRDGANLQLYAPDPLGPATLTESVFAGWLARDRCAGDLKCINPIAWP